MDLTITTTEAPLILPQAWIVCLVCGRKLQYLGGGGHSGRRGEGHLGTHGLTTEEYVLKYPGAQISSPQHRERLSGAHSAQAADLRGRPRLNLPTLPGHGDEKPVRIAEIASLCAQGFTLQEIATKLNRGLVTIWKIVCRAGLDSDLYSFGEAFNSEAARGLKTRIGLSAAEFAKYIHVGASARTVSEYIRKRHRHFDRKTAKKISDGRKKIIAKLMSKGQKEYPRGRVLKTFFPDLPAKYKFFCEILVECRLFLRSTSSAGLRELEDYICDQGDRAMMDARGPRVTKLFGRFIPWMPDVLPLVNLNQLRSKGPIRDSACVAMAAYWGSTPDIMRNAVDPRTRQIPPNEMRLLIRSFNQKADHAEDTKQSRGVQNGRRGLRQGSTIGDTEARITVTASLGEMAPGAMASYLYPNQNSKDHARHSTVVFLGRHRLKINLEQQRLAGLSDTQREIEVKIAYEKLRSVDPGHKK